MFKFLISARTEINMNEETLLLEANININSYEDQ